MMKRAFLAIFFIPIFIWVSSVAKEDVTATKNQQCIKLQNIRSTPVIDDKTILVILRGKKYKRINLLNRCFGLKIEGGFIYSSSINKLCIQDSLKVINSRGICMIDNIVNITAEEAKELRTKK